MSPPDSDNTGQQDRVHNSAACEKCGKPQTADHWQRIAHGWERLVNYALIFGVVVGAGVVGVVWAAVEHR